MKPQKLLTPVLVKGSPCHKGPYFHQFWLQFHLALWFRASLENFQPALQSLRNLQTNLHLHLWQLLYMETIIWFLFLGDFHAEKMVAPPCEPHLVLLEEDRWMETSILEEKFRGWISLLLLGRQNRQIISWVLSLLGTNCQQALLSIELSIKTQTLLTPFVDRQNLCSLVMIQ